MNDPMSELEALRQGNLALPKKPTPAGDVLAEPGVRSTLNEQEATLLVSAVFRSRSENSQPHVVSVGYDGIVTCTCRATNPCWAVKGFCAMTGRATP